MGDGEMVDPLAGLEVWPGFAVVDLSGFAEVLVLGEGVGLVGFC